MKDILGENAKAVASLVGVLVTLLVTHGVIPETEAGAVTEGIVTLVCVALTVYATWRVPNKPKDTLK